MKSELENIPIIVHGDKFKTEMLRFLPSDVFERTLAKAKFTEYLVQTISSLLNTLKSQLYVKNSTLDEFKM